MATRKKVTKGKSGTSAAQVSALLRPGFGKRLKELRERARLNQYEVAAKIGLNFATVSRFEAGINMPERLVTLVLLAAVLDCSTDYLLFGEELEVRGNKKVQQIAESLKHLSRDQVDAVGVLVESMRRGR